MEADRGRIDTMERLSMSEFRATCLARLERVQQTGQPLLITKRGVPIAQVLPPPPADAPGTGFGVMAGTVRELGDIVAPLDWADREAVRRPWNWHVSGRRRLQQRADSGR